MALSEYMRLVMSFYTRSKCDPILRGHRSHFREIGISSRLQVNVSKTIYRSELKLSLSCSVFNSEQNDILCRYFGRIFVMLSIPEGNNVTLAEKKSPEDKLGQCPWLTPKAKSGATNRSMWRLSQITGLLTSRNPTNRQLSHYRHLSMSSEKVSDLG